MKIKIDPFVLGIIIVIILAYLFPQWGTGAGKGVLDAISTVGISLIFFFYGLQLSSEKLKAGLKNWRLHLIVQASTFLLFPLLVLPAHTLIQNEAQETIWLAFFFLAALPSTVSSSVVMVSMAKGNIPAAIFNASISGIIGIIITPLWMGLFLNAEKADFNFSSIYVNLIVQIIIPVLLGLFFQRFLGSFAQKNRTRLATIDKLIILIIIFKSFAASFDENIFNGVSALDLAFIFMGVMALFIIMYFLTGFLAKKFALSREDQITTQFCGTKKSLVHGTIFSKILFGNMAAIGIILLPLMLFHAAQILIISVIATKKAQRKLATG